VLGLQLVTIVSPVCHEDRQSGRDFSRFQTEKQISRRHPCPYFPEVIMQKFHPFLSSSKLIVAATLFLPAATPALAQVDRSAITGTITDSSGRLLYSAHVIAIENATQLRREGVSDADGRYEITELPIGTYTVIVEHPGFATLTFAEVGQVVGRTRTLDAMLNVAGREEQVTVSAASELLDRNSSAITGLIEKKQADELPLNGRDWSTLTAFIPGAIDTGGSNQRSVRFAGRGLDDSNFTYDGVDETSIVNRRKGPGCAYPFLLMQSPSFASIPCWQAQKRAQREVPSWPLLRLLAPISSMGGSSSFFATTSLTRLSPLGLQMAKHSNPCD
jgi:hypothetical protein